MPTLVIIGIVLLILVGISLILSEIFFTPGLIVGILGVILLVTGIAITYKQFGSAAGNYTTGATAAITVAGVILLFRFNTWNKLMLKDSIEGKVNLIDTEKIKVGDSGTTISRLAPAGMAFIHEEKYEVESVGEFINQNTGITVVKVTPNKIWVKIKADPPLAG